MGGVKEGAGNDARLSYVSTPEKTSRLHYPPFPLLPSRVSVVAFFPSSDVPCGDPGYHDRATTNGECKTYGGVLALVVPPSLQGGSGASTQDALDCQVRVDVLANRGAYLNLCGDGGGGAGGGSGLGAALCTEGASPWASGPNLATMPSGNLAATRTVGHGDDGFEAFGNYSVTGPAASVAAALGNFSFCPSCIATDYTLVVRATALNGSACVVNNDAWSVTIRAATALKQVR